MRAILDFNSTIPFAFDPPSSYNTLHAANGNFDFARIYRAPYFSLFFFPGGRNFYINAGWQYNRIAQPGNVSLTSRSSDGQSLQLDAHFARQYPATYLEMGFRIGGTTTDARKLIRRTSLGYFVGLRYYFAGETLNGTYQNTLAGKVQYSDAVSATGRYLSLSFRVGIPFTTVKKKELKRKFARARTPKSLKKAKKRKSKKIREKQTSDDWPMLQKIRPDNTRGF